MSRLDVLNFGLRYVARPFLLRTKTPAHAKRDLERVSRFVFREPIGLNFEAEAVTSAAGIPIARITAGPVDDSCAILFFHGGGYVAGSPFTHRGMLGRLSQLAGVPVYAPNYRLAQEAPFPAAFDDAQSVWEALTQDGFFAPDHLVLGGDSAGGGLALSLMASLLAEGMSPAGLFAFSPWTDLTLTGASLVQNAGRDAILPRARMEELVEIVMGSGDPADPRISPYLAEWIAPPPVYLQASETEILRDDTVRLAERLRTAGGDVSVDLWEDAPHVWQLFDGWIPQARDALARTAEFTRAQLHLRES